MTRKPSTQLQDQQEYQEEQRLDESFFSSQEE